MSYKPLEDLQALLKERGIGAVVIPTSDFHDTEYVCDYFNERAHFSGFTGSAGTLVVLPDEAALWTDGRYFIQAARQMAPAGIALTKMGEEDTPSIAQYLADHLGQGDVLALDGRTVSTKALEEYEAVLTPKGVTIQVDEDLPGQVWPDRPAMPATETFHYDEKYTGESVSHKLARVREKMQEAGARYHLTNKVDEIAWLFNLRAHDIPSFPVALGYALITPDGGVLYINQERLDDESRKILEDNNIRIADYDQVYEDAKNLEGPVLAQKDLLNSRLGKSLKEPIWGTDPVIFMKAMKNPVELEGFRTAHLKDGAAVVKFWKWLEETLAKGEKVTETSAARRLTEFRAEQPLYVEDSFTTIPAYEENAALPHYHADDANPVELKEQGLFLVDSGGHYLDGTTDITRTFVLGPITDKERRGFTRVLQGHINLANAVYPHGVRGVNLDALARMPMWQEFMDFNHGTGHGVGALSNVHEAPNGYRWKIVPERNDSCVLEEGMVTSNEPGLYLEGEFGIRHENLMATVKATEDGRWLKQEILTMVPFDVRGLDLSLMDASQIDWLNNYHQEVYEKISPLLSEEEEAWLKDKTRPVHA